MPRIDQFISAAALALADFIPLGQGANTRKTTLESLKTFFTGDLSSQMSDVANQVAGWRIYNNITELGLTSGSETIETICSAMANKSILEFTVATTSTATCYPINGGKLKVEKIDSNRIEVRYIYGSGAGTILKEWIGFSYGGIWTGFKQLADGTDTGWINLPLGTATAGATVPAYRKIGNRVFIRGYCTNIAANGDVIATLPTGYRPTTTINTNISIGAGAYVGRISIAAYGTIAIQAINTTHSTSLLYFLDNISFLVD